MLLVEAAQVKALLFVGHKTISCVWSNVLINLGILWCRPTASDNTWVSGIWFVRVYWRFKQKRHRDRRDLWSFWGTAGFCCGPRLYFSLHPFHFVSKPPSNVIRVLVLVATEWVTSCEDFILKGKCNTETNEEQDGTDVFMLFVRPIIFCAFDVISCCGLPVVLLMCSNAKEMRDDMVIIEKRTVVWGVPCYLPHWKLVYQLEFMTFSDFNFSFVWWNCVEINWPPPQEKKKLFQIMWNLD